MAWPPAWPSHGKLYRLGANYAGSMADPSCSGSASAKKAADMSSLKLPEFFLLFAEASFVGDSFAARTGGEDFSPAEIVVVQPTLQEDTPD